MCRLFGLGAYHIFLSLKETQHGIFLRLFKEGGKTQHYSEQRYHNISSETLSSRLVSKIKDFSAESFLILVFNES